jgi:hypothetical protein
MNVHPVHGDFIETTGSVTLVPNETTDVEVDVKGALEISSQFKNTIGNNTTVKIFPALLLGYAKLTIKDVTLVSEDNQIIKIDTGYYSLKFQLKNNDTVNTNVEYFISVKK